MPARVYLAGMLIVAIAAFPMARWFARGRPGAPMFELLCLAFGLQYGLIVYLQPNQVWTELRNFTPLSWGSTFRAQLLAATGIGSLIAGYFCGGRLAPLRPVPRLDLPLRPPRLFWYLCFAFTVGLAAALLNARYAALTQSRVGALLYLLSSQGHLGLIVLTDYVYRLRKGWRWKAGLYALLALTCLIGMTTGMQEHILVPLILVFIARWLAVGALPWRLLLVGAAVFLLLYPLKFRYRTAAWIHQKEAAQTFAGRAAIWRQVMSDFVREAAQGRTEVFSQQQLRVSLYRFDLLHLFAMVHDKTPSQVPFYRGASYEYLLYTWVPRAVWPGKPTAQQANTTFALDYEITDEKGAKFSSFGIGILAEAYANFGVPGVILLMGLKGLIFAALNRALNSKESQGGRAIYISLVVPFFNGIGSSTVMMFGSLAQHVLARAVILRFFAVGFRAVPPPSSSANE